MAHFLAHFVVVFYLLSLAQGYFLVGVVHFAVGHNDTVVVDLEIAFVGIGDDVVVLIGAVCLGEDTAETFFQHADQCGAVNVVFLFEVGESLYQLGRIL